MYSHVILLSAISPGLSVRNSTELGALTDNVRKREPQSCREDHLRSWRSEHVPWPCCVVSIFSDPSVLLVCAQGKEDMLRRPPRLPVLDESVAKISTSFDGKTQTKKNQQVQGKVGGSSHILAGESFCWPGMTWGHLVSPA